MSWYAVLGAGLLFLSAVLYLVHYAIFRDAHHIFIYMLGDIAFMPIEVLLVAIIVHRVLDAREKKTRMEKLNMVIGAFFSEMGMQLLRSFSRFDAACREIRECFSAEPDWGEADFREARRKLEDYECAIGRDDRLLEDMREFLLSKRDFLLTLLENPTLLEHETFTDLLWAVFHLAEELKYRYLLEGLPESDHEHLCSDIARAYSLLLREWLAYLEHLKANYPYLFSLAVRMNPLDPEASAVVT
ncbi:MAG: hypothetical protein H5T73_11430 [Actinobacteria bacterium]|nr:hypothetical protein [Actinomycetota bacterium]